MHFDPIADRLKGSLFLSSMMGWTDAAFAASRADGCAMVQLGAYVLLHDHPQRDAYRPDPRPDQLVAFMRDQFDACRRAAAERLGEDAVPLIAANVFPCTDADLAGSATAFIEARGDVYELNAHGGIGNDRERGTGCMLFLPEHTPKLFRWAQTLVDAGGPVIIKGRIGGTDDLTGHVRRFEEIGVDAFHLNVRGAKKGEQDVALLERVRKATGLFLLASGYVTDTTTARRLFDAGADAVGIAEAALPDPDIIAKLAADGATGV
jgi:tRNA-dihydrouridine synthase